MTRCAALLWTVCAAAVQPATAAGDLPGDPLAGSGDVARTALPASQLLAGEHPTPVDNAAFALPENAAPPRHEMRGTLQLFGGGGASWTVHHDTY
ncbi:MAG: hypothetical protein F4230_11910, partial [Holophagales bacterium]|nr:hypothetical protein [Holophagales bacterium]